MAHATQNFMTKKELVQAVKAGEEVYVEQNPFFGGFGAYGDGTKTTIEGPYGYDPKTGRERAHRWYASAVIERDTGRVISVK